MSSNPITRASDAEVALASAVLAVETLSHTQASVLLARATSEARSDSDVLTRLFWASYADLIRRRFGEFDSDPLDEVN